mmetsp:Transcript_43919/g.70605  ORF Transcript_43919/g.70605 Transcript_43919/m.70605 type:complete len:206 (-) Transcript_43919:209-826(-)
MRQESRWRRSGVSWRLLGRMRAGRASKRSSSDRELRLRRSLVWRQPTQCSLLPWTRKPPPPLSLQLLLILSRCPPTPLLPSSPSIPTLPPRQLQQGNSLPRPLPPTTAPPPMAPGAPFPPTRLFALGQTLPSPPLTTPPLTTTPPPPPPPSTTPPTTTSPYTRKRRRRLPSQFSRCSAAGRRGGKSPASRLRGRVPNLPQSSTAS